MSTSMDMPMIGQVNKNIFWGILVAALLALAGLVTMASKGAVALALTIPAPFTVTTTSLTTTSNSFKMFPGLSQADGQSPVAVAQLDADINNMVVTKAFSFAGHTITVKLNAGQNSPVVASGLTLDASGLNMDSAAFNGMSINAGGTEGTGGLTIASQSASFTNATINSPYLLVNSITLPGLSLSINIS